MNPKFSVVVPVFNRPQEVEELLESLTHQTINNFEVILVEDGSTVTSQHVYEKYSGKLRISYYFKPNSGPGPSRNLGFEKAAGQYMVIFDSDCIIPPTYFESVEKALAQSPLDAWGGPDKGSESFTPTQRAMAYTMSSILTTGGIRGGSALNFQPRSFNMGVRKEVVEQTGGFHFDRFAEDIEWSIRLKKAGFRTGLVPEAFVYHKRRTDFNKFFQQVSNFGKGRVLVGRTHPDAIKLTHWFPTFFLLGLFVIPVLTLFPVAGLLVVGLYDVYFLAIILDAWRKTESVKVALLSLPAALIQLTGYGFGFLREMLRSDNKLRVFEILPL